MTAPAATELAYHIPADAGLGHAHLKVSDLSRALEFYCGVLGFSLVARYHDSAAFLAAGDYHHHLGLNTWESEGAAPPPPHHTGLHHLAIRYPTRTDLAVAVSGASDHGVSVSVYLSDPDGTGLELTWDRPAGEWPHTPDGSLEYRVEDVLDVEALLSEE
jgi:catechol 2,3-dioxygenase